MNDIDFGLLQVSNDLHLYRERVRERIEEIEREKRRMAEEEARITRNIEAIYAAREANR